MKLSISNIAWFAEDDEKMYEVLQEKGFEGLEIAPTRVISQNPYDHIDYAKKWVLDLKEKYGFVVPSMQSIWFGRTEKIFGTEEERKSLCEYTKKAVDWAEAIGCRNLVFGCPRNRNIPDDCDRMIGVSFFKELGDYACEHNCVIGMEANPPIYNTNYINDTVSAIALIKQVDSRGFRLNLDIGTMLACNESLAAIEEDIELISHIHISEPGLAAIEKRAFHTELFEMLAAAEYENFVSIEMSNSNGLDEVKRAIGYVTAIVGK